MPTGCRTFHCGGLIPLGTCSLLFGQTLLTLTSRGFTAPAALDMAARGERTIVFPTRMNLSLLAQAGSIADAIAAAAGRPARVVEPVVELHGDKRFLRLQAEDGYGPALEPLLF